MDFDLGLCDFEDIVIEGVVMIADVCSAVAAALGVSKTLALIRV